MKLGETKQEREYSYFEIAKILGLKPERIRQIEFNAMKKIYQLLKEKQEVVSGSISSPCKSIF